MFQYYYCFAHKCKSPPCENRALTGFDYCFIHKCVERDCEEPAVMAEFVYMKLYDLCAYHQSTQNDVVFIK